MKSMKGGLHMGLTRKNPMQMQKGDPKMASAYPSVDSDVDRKGTAATPKTLGPRDA